MPDRRDIREMVIPALHPAFEAVATHSATDYWLAGGRGSTKSSFVSMCVVLLLVAHPDANAVCVRRYASTLRSTVYEQVLWAVHALGYDAWFRASKSPLEVTYLPTGQKVAFVGLDDPRKAKGLVFPTGYGAVTWLEELDEVESWDKVSSLLRTLRRGGDDFWTFYTYNPPRSRWSWVNRQALEMERRDGCVCSKTTYLDVLDGGHADWLGEQFVADAEYEREEHPERYRWEFLGEATGTGGSVFDNLSRVDLSDAEVAGFDNPRCGVDWGWFPDPWRFVRCDWQPGQRRLVIYDERSATRRTPAETAAMVREALTYPDAPGGEPRYHRDRVLCDDAEPASIEAYRRAGVNAAPASKGRMRRASYTWLAGLREIAIDPRRCPLTYQEFALCEYERDREGRFVDSFADGDDHSIDAVRYATMREAMHGR